MSKNLHVYEEITLLALREEAGTVISSSIYPYAVAGAIAAELLLADRIRVEDSKEAFVEVANDATIDDELLGECLERIRTTRRRARLRDWVGRIAGTRGLKRRVAEGLCRRGILRVDEQQVLLVFRQKVYPELDPRPEREIVARLRKAIFTDSQQIDRPTIVLLALAQAADLLRVPFTRGELGGRRARIKALASGEVVGRATAEAIHAMEAAVVIAATAAGAAS